MPANGITPSTTGAPTRVTLSLGHLPNKKDIKAPWPRTPTRVCTFLTSLFLPVLIDPG
jgi:hypothetical protein